MSIRVQLVIGGLIACALAPRVDAQVLTQRLSHLTWNYVYGAGGDSHTDAFDQQTPDPFLSDTVDSHILGWTSGVLPGGSPYTAGIECTINHSYQILGSASEIEQISATGFSSVHATVTGAGSAGMYSGNPGNELQFNFEVLHAIDYRLHGALNHPAPGAFSSVLLQRFNGFNWSYLYWSASQLPGGVGAFDVSGTLSPGQYRIWSTLSLSATGEQDFNADYSYALELAGAGGCACDLNGDGQVDDADFVLFVLGYNLLDCSDPAMFEGCPADFNRDGVVDDSDFVSFVVAYNALLCE